MVADQSADPAPMLGFLSAALAAVVADGASNEDPTNVGLQEAAAATKTEAERQQGLVFDELKKMVMHGEQSITNDCKGYSAATNTYISQYFRLKALWGIDCTNEEGEEDFETLDCITKTAEAAYDQEMRDSIMWGNSPLKSEDWVVECNAARANGNMSAACTVPFPHSLVLLSCQPSAFGRNLQCEPVR
jgi:hypothetical protein